MKGFFFFRLDLGVGEGADPVQHVPSSDRSVPARNAWTLRHNASKEAPIFGAVRPLIGGVDAFQGHDELNISGQPNIATHYRLQNLKRCEFYV